jgi:hypothetical protein
MKKIVFGAMALAMLTSGLTSCQEDDDVIVQPIVVTVPGSTILSIGGTATFAAGIEASDLLWKSTDVNVVSVVDGLVTGVNAGTADITVSSVKEKYSKTVTYTVIGAAVVNPAIVLNATQYQVKVEGTSTVKVFNEKGEDITANVVLESNDVEIFKMVGTTLTGVKAGTATLKAYVDGNESVYSEATVTVRAKDAEDVKVTSVKVSVDNVALLRGDKFKVSASVFPQDAVNADNGVWTIEDAAIATISADGLIEGLEIGDTKATYTVDGVSAYVLVKVGRAILTDFYYNDSNAVYSLGTVGKSESDKLVSCAASVNKGAKVTYAIKSVGELTDADDIAELISVDAKTGVVSTEARFKVGTYEIVITATPEYNVTVEDEDGVKEAKMTLTSEADLLVAFDGFYQCRRGDAFIEEGSTSVITANNSYELAGIEATALTGYFRDELESFNERYDIVGNKIVLNESVLDCEAEYLVYVYLTAVHEDGDENNVALNVSAASPTSSDQYFAVSVVSYLEELFFTASAYSSTHITEKEIINYYVNEVKTNTKSDFVVHAHANDQCEADLEVVSMINTDTDAEVTRDEFFKFTKVDMYGYWFEYQLSSNEEKVIPNGTYVIKIKATDSYDPMKVDVMTKDLTVTVTSDVIDWDMLTATDRDVTNLYTGSIISNENGDVAGITLKLSDTTHFELDVNKNVVLKSGVTDGVYPLTVRVQDTRNFIGVDVQILDITVNVSAAE